MAEKNTGYYDSVVILDSPIVLRDDEGEGIYIYGLLYEKERSHQDEIFIWELRRYLSYLKGCEKILDNGCALAPEIWVMEDGRMINLTVEHKNLIHRIMGDRIQSFTLEETNQPLILNPEHTEDIFVTSPEFFIENDLVKDTLTIY